MAHQQIEGPYRELMQRVAKALDEGFKPAGFCLLVFPLNTSNGRVNYISNADRATMLAAMKEFIARAEGRVVDGAEGHD